MATGADALVRVAHGVTKVCLCRISLLLDVTKRRNNEQLLANGPRGQITNAVNRLAEQYPIACCAVHELWQSHRIPRTEPYCIVWGGMAITKANAHDALLDLCGLVAGVLHFGLEPNAGVSSADLMFANDDAERLNISLSAAARRSWTFPGLTSDDTYLRFIDTLRNLPLIAIDQYLADLDIERDALLAATPTAREQATPVIPPDGPEPPKPNAYLRSWRQILDALGLKNNKECREWVRKMNMEFDGPIILPTRGGQPKVEKSKLIEWWNKLEIAWNDQTSQAAGRQLSAESQHPFGRSGTVAPGVAGGVKRRRKRET